MSKKHLILVQRPDGVWDVAKNTGIPKTVLSFQEAAAKVKAGGGVPVLSSRNAWLIPSGRNAIDEHAPCSLSVKSGQPYLTHDGKTYPFTDGMQVDGQGKPIGVEPVDLKAQSAERRRDKLAEKRRQEMEDAIGFCEKIFAKKPANSAGRQSGQSL